MKHKPENRDDLRLELELGLQPIPNNPNWRRQPVNRKPIAIVFAEDFHRQEFTDLTTAKPVAMAIH